jgi:hypothetical protein
MYVFYQIFHLLHKFLLSRSVLSHIVLSLLSSFIVFSGAGGGQRRRHRAGVKNYFKSKTFLTYPLYFSLLIPNPKPKITKSLPKLRIGARKFERKKENLLSLFRLVSVLLRFLSILFVQCVYARGRFWRRRFVVMLLFWVWFW